MLHRFAVPIHAVDNHHSNALAFDEIQQQVSELPRRKLGGIDLPGMKDALANKWSKINSEICRLGEIKIQVFIERENCCSFTSRDSTVSIGNGETRFSGPRG